MYDNICKNIPFENVSDEKLNRARDALLKSFLKIGVRSFQQLISGQSDLTLDRRLQFIQCVRTDTIKVFWPRFPILLLCSICRHRYCTNAAHKCVAVVSLALSWHHVFLSLISAVHYITSASVSTRFSLVVDTWFKVSSLEKKSHVDRSEDRGVPR